MKPTSTLNPSTRQFPIGAAPPSASLRRNASLTGATPTIQQSLSRSHGHSSGMRSSASTPNIRDLMTQSAPGRKQTKHRTGTFNPSLLSQSARTEPRPLPLLVAEPTAFPPPSAESLALILKPTTIDLRPRCAVCEAALSVLPIDQAVASDESLASVLHLQTIPDPMVGDANDEDDALDRQPDHAYVYVRDEVWENQYFADGVWARATGVVPAYIAADSNLPLDSLPEKTSSTSTWLDDWAPDVLVSGCDGEGWLYAATFAQLDDALLSSTSMQRARRRRLVRHRKIRHTEEGWWNEVMDRRHVLHFSSLKTPTCHSCAEALQRTLRIELAQLDADDAAYDDYLADDGDDPDLVGLRMRPVKAKGRPKPPAKMSHLMWQDSSVDEDDDEVDLETLSLEELEAKARALEDLLRLVDDESALLLRNRELIWSCATELAGLQREAFEEGAIVQLGHTTTKEERASVATFAVHASDVLRCLQRYNVFNDAFHIWHDGSFGTINGLRLGRLPSKPVEWTEINAALGQATLLVATVASRANLTFSRHTPVARGSYSKMLTAHGKERKKEYPLFSDGSFFQRQKFNQALVFFLECIEEAGNRAMREEPSLRFPYKIFKGKIGELAISVGGNDEQWTRALKYLLTHLKWLLAWIAKRYP
ncbi:beclin-1-like protein [Achlya hypogyna]|uniref:Beclin-1-like protein n=1 Tax=Achlya hypogyna TaxID=1202772 RepID=A0A1V9ZP10_ACHHY|nr:beclin-1-like protein [Achlya hypogyna]